MGLRSGLAEASPGASQPPPEGFEARLASLERIVRELERDDLELETALSLFEEGVANLRAARDQLAQTELRIERLLEAEEGAPVREPIDQASEERER